MEKVDANFLPWTIENIMWDEGLLLWVRFGDWHMSHFLIYCLTASVKPDQDIYSHAQSRVFSSPKWPTYRYFRNSSIAIRESLAYRSWRLVHLWMRVHPGSFRMNMCSFDAFSSFFAILVKILLFELAKYLLSLCCHS